MAPYSQDITLKQALGSIPYCAMYRVRLRTRMVPLSLTCQMGPNTLLMAALQSPPTFSVQYPLRKTRLYFLVNFADKLTAQAGHCYLHRRFSSISLRSRSRRRSLGRHHLLTFVSLLVKLGRRDRRQRLEKCSDVRRL